MKQAREGETKAADMKKEGNLIAMISLATRNEGRTEGRSEGVVACIYSNCGMATAPSICVHVLWRCKLQLNYRFFPFLALSLSSSLLLLLPSFFILMGDAL